MNIMRLIQVFFLSIVLSGCAVTAPVTQRQEKLTKHYEGSFSEKTEKDLYSVETEGGHKHTPVMKSAELDLSSSKYTENRIFLVSYESNLEPVPVNAVHSWIVTVKQADGNPVVNAHMTINGDMPEHGHGLPTRPEVTVPEVTQSLGSGSYRIDGVKFNMPGWWTVHVRINTNAKEDSVTFNLLLPQ
jgi:hypothetical protein